MIIDASSFVAFTTVNITETIIDEGTQFVVDRLLYWISLGITLAAAIGLGFQGIRWLRKKTAEDRKKENEKFEKRFDEHMKEMKEYVSDISSDAKQRRDKDEYMLEELIKRVDKIEEQQQMQMKIVLENQQTITDFIASQRKGPGRPRRDSLNSLAP